MKAALATVGHPARGLGVGIGWISLSLGLALTLAPDKTGNLLGWGERKHLAGIIGAADLVVGSGLLLSPRPSRWMLARTLLNVVIAGAYAGVLSAETPGAWAGHRRRVHDGRPDRQRLLPVEAPAGDRSLVESSRNAISPTLERRHRM